MERKWLEQVQTKVQFYYHLNKYIDKDYQLDDHIYLFTFLLYGQTAINKNDIDIFVEAHFSSGFGDVFNAIKTCDKLRSLYGYNARLVTFNDTDGNEDDDTIRNFLRGSSYNVSIIKESSLTRLRKKKARLTFKVALPDRTNEIEMDYYIRIDEYNGWRFMRHGKGRIPHRSMVIEMSAGIGTGRWKFPSTGLLLGSKCAVENLDGYFYFAYNSQPDDDFFNLDTLAKYFFTIIEKERKRETIAIHLVGTSAKCVRSLKWDEIQGKILPASDDGQVVVEVKNGPLVTIIIQGKLVHKDFISLLARSQEPVLVSGDQSFTEAIEFNKLFFYQLQSWKEDLYNAYLKICKLVSEEKTVGVKRTRHGSVTHPFYHFQTNTVPFDRLLDKQPEMTPAQLAMYLNTNWDKIQEEKRVVYDTIKEMYDISPAIDSVLKFTIVGQEMFKEFMKFMQRLYSTPKVTEKLVNEFQILKMKLERKHQKR
uniref:Uncharacterized protein n=1 Tax=viral metagenome TaxID=1070528 RepID=A0A6C0ELJ2_9ZZZZ